MFNPSKNSKPIEKPNEKPSEKSLTEIQSSETMPDEKENPDNTTQPKANEQPFIPTMSFSFGQKRATNTKKKVSSIFTK